MTNTERYGYLKAEIRGSLKGLENFLAHGWSESPTTIKAENQVEILRELMEAINKLDNQ